MKNETLKKAEELYGIQVRYTLEKLYDSFDYQKTFFVPDGTIEIPAEKYLNKKGMKAVLRYFAYRIISIIIILLLIPSCHILK